MVKYSCERCGKRFSQKSHYDSHNIRKTPCENNADKIKIKELNNKKLIIEKKEVNVNTFNTNTPKMNKISNISPLRYPGGKTRACNKLDTILKEHFDISKFNNILSPFFGGGSFEFHIQNNYKLKIIANDKFVPLYNFWKTCKSDKENLCKELTKKIDLIDKEEFTNLREKNNGRKE